MTTNIINVSLYQAGWFSCVLGAAWDYPISGAIIAVTLTGLHVFLASHPKAELKVMFFACVLGVVVDSIQQAAGVFTFRQAAHWPLWLPLWVFVIWAQFATLFHYALRWLAGRYVLAAIFGFLGGPLAYWSGAKLGAAHFGENLLFSFLSLAITWTVVTPFLVWLSHRAGEGESHYRFPKGV